MKKTIRIFLMVNAKTGDVRLTKKPTIPGLAEVRVRVNLALDIPAETEAVLNAIVTLPSITVQQIEATQESAHPVMNIQQLGILEA